MERKNTILLTVIAIATLLVAVVGATFAYFTATINTEKYGEDQGKTNVTAGSVASNTIIANVETAAANISEDDAYPGHVEVAALSVQATSTENAISKFNIIYKATKNEYSAESFNIHLYKYEPEEDTPIATTDNYFTCNHAIDDVGSTETEIHYIDKCNDWTSASANKLITSGATLVETKLLSGEKVEFTGQEITGSATGKTVYYYVVVEYINKSSTQNADFSKTLEGKISVELAA